MRRFCRGLVWALWWPWLVAWSPETVEHRDPSSGDAASSVSGSSIALPVVDPARLQPTMTLPWPGPGDEARPRSLSVSLEAAAGPGLYGHGLAIAWPRICRRPTHRPHGASASPGAEEYVAYWEGRPHDLVALESAPGSGASPWLDTPSERPPEETLPVWALQDLPPSPLPAAPLAPLRWSEGVDAWWASRDASSPFRLAHHPEVAGAWVLLDGLGRRLEFGLTEAGRTRDVAGVPRCWEVERATDTGRGVEHWRWVQMAPGEAPRLREITAGTEGGSSVVWAFETNEMDPEIGLDAGYIVEYRHRVKGVTRRTLDSAGHADGLVWSHRYHFAGQHLARVEDQAGDLPLRPLLRLAWEPVPWSSEDVDGERRAWRRWLSELPQEGDGVVLWGATQGRGALEPVVHRSDGRLVLPNRASRRAANGAAPAATRWLDLPERGGLHLLSGSSAFWQLERLVDGRLVSMAAPLSAVPGDPALHIVDLWGRGRPDLAVMQAGRVPLVAEFGGMAGCVDRASACPVGWSAPAPMRGPHGREASVAEGVSWAVLLGGGPSWWVEPQRDGRGVHGVHAWPPGGAAGVWGPSRAWRWDPVPCDAGTEGVVPGRPGEAARWTCRVGNRLVQRRLTLESFADETDVYLEDRVLPEGLDYRILRPHGAAGLWVLGWSERRRQWHVLPLEEARPAQVLRAVDVYDGRRVEFHWTRTRQDAPATALPWDPPSARLLPWPVVHDVHRWAAGPWEASLEERWTPGEELDAAGAGFAESLVVQRDLSDEAHAERHTRYRFGLGACVPAGVVALEVLRGGQQEQAFWGEHRRTDTVWVRGRQTVENGSLADRCAEQRVESTRGFIAQPEDPDAPDDQLAPGLLRERTYWVGPTRPVCEQSLWRDRANEPLRASRLRCASWVAGDAHADWMRGWQEWDGEGLLRAGLRLQPDPGTRGLGPGRGVILTEEAWSAEEGEWIRWTTRGHDALGRRLEERDAMGRRTLWRWGGPRGDRPTGRVLLPPEGAPLPPDTDHLEVAWRWDSASGALLTQRDANGRWWSRKVDARGREVSQGRGPLGVAPDELHTYWPPEPGRVPARRETVRRADPSPDLEETSWWSTSGALLAKVRAGTLVVHHERRNAWDEVVERCRPWTRERSATTLPRPPEDHACERTTYDALGRVVEVRDALRVQRWVHGTSGVLHSLFEPRGTAPLRSVWTLTDAWGEVLERVEGQTQGATRRWRYDRDQVDGTLRLHFPSGLQRTWRQDSQGRIVEVEDPAAGVTRYFYDAGGRQVATEDATGSLSGTDVDGLGRPIRRWETLDGNETTRVELRWDREDLVERASEHLHRRWSLDALGRIESTEVTTPEGRWISGTQWDRLDRPIEHRYADGSRQPLRWNRLGHLASLPGAFPEIHADASGHYRSWTTGAGWREVHEVDVAGRPRAWTLSGPTQSLSVHARFSALGEPAARTTVSASPGFSRHRWHYDDWGRLAGWRASGAGASASLQPWMDEEDQWLGDAANPLQACALGERPWLPEACGERPLRWDAAGRLTAIGGATLEWGSDALPRSMTDEDGTEHRWWMAPDGSVEREEEVLGAYRRVRIHLDPAQVVEVVDGQPHVIKSLSLAGEVRLSVRSSLRQSAGASLPRPLSQGLALSFLLILVLLGRARRRPPWVALSVLLMSCAAHVPSAPLLAESGETKWWFHDPLGDRTWYAEGTGGLRGPWSLDPQGFVVEGADVPESLPGWQGMTPVAEGRMWRAATRLWFPAIGRWASPDPLVLASPQTPWRDAQPYARAGGRWDVWEDPSGRIGLRRFLESVADWSPEDFGRLMAQQQAWDDRHWSDSSLGRLGFSADVLSGGVSVLRGQSPLGAGSVVSLTTAMMEGVSVADNAGHYIASAEAEALQLLMVARAGGREAQQVGAPRGYGPRAQASWSAAAARTQRRIYRWTDTRSRTAGSFDDSFEGRGHFGRHAGYHAVAFLSHAASWSPEEAGRFAEAYFEARTQVQMSQTLLPGVRTNSWLDRSGHRSSVGRWARALP